MQMNFFSCSVLFSVFSKFSMPIIFVIRRKFNVLTWKISLIFFSLNYLDI